MRSLGAIIPVWNEERFIRSHIKMLEPFVDEIIIILGNRPLNPYKKEHNYSDIPDRSREIVQNEFSQHALYDYETNDENPAMMFANIWNFGRTKINTDIVFKLDCDMFFTREDLKKFTDFARQSYEKQIALDWSRDSINYYMDLDHGLKDQVETDPLIFDPKFEMGALLSYQHKKYIADLGITLHHLRGFNKPLVTKEWIEGKKPFPSGLYSTSLVERYGNNGKWYVAPEEIKKVVYGDN